MKLAKDIFGLVLGVLGGMAIVLGIFALALWGYGISPVSETGIVFLSGAAFLCVIYGVAQFILIRRRHNPRN